MKVCIVGAGKLGLAIAQSLLGAGHKLTIVDKDPVRIQNAGNSMDSYTVQAEALKVDELRALGIGEYDLFIACTEEDERNITLCAFAEKLGCPSSIARVRSPEHLQQLDFIRETFGIDLLINPDYSCAREIYRFLTQKYSLEGGMFTQGSVSILEFDIAKMPGLEGKQIKDLGGMLTGMLIGAVSRDGKIIVPNGGTLLQSGDTIYAVGHSKDMYRLAGKVRDKDQKTGIKRVMIAGGGKTGHFLAQMLGNAGVFVRIVEIDEERCRQLASELADAEVLCGDASDINVLREEGLESMDAFVAATGFDEENMLLSMLVKEYGVPDVVAKISRQTYAPIMKKLASVMVINPQEIIASEVLSYVRRSGVVLFSKIINGQAEFKEILAEDDMPITKKTLFELDIPEGVLVVSVTRSHQIIIPNGSTQIQAGDRVLFLTMLSAGAEFESLLSESNKSVL